MKTVNTCILTLFLFLISIGNSFSQTCLDGSTPETITLDLTNTHSAGVLGSVGNSKGNLCFLDDEEHEIIAASWSDVQVNPIGYSWCNEARIDFNGALKLTPSSEGNIGPCSGPNSSSSNLILDDIGINFSSDPLGCITWEAYEFFDDNNANTADQTFSDGQVTIYGCRMTVALPVELTSFFLEKEDKTVVLNWTTSSEINNTGFFVEHSKDGINYERISWIEGQGNTTEIHDYKFIHDAPNMGLNYYKLAQKDEDGTIHYSEVEVAEFQSKFHATVFPNPSELGDRTNLQIYTETSKAVKIQVTDIMRNISFELNTELYEGENNIHIPYDNLSAGLYLVFIAHNGRIIEHLKLSVME